MTTRPPLSTLSPKRQKHSYRASPKIIRNILTSTNKSSKKRKPSHPAPHTPPLKQKKLSNTHQIPVSPENHPNTPITPKKTRTPNGKQSFSKMLKLSLKRKKSSKRVRGSRGPVQRRMFEEGKGMRRSNTCSALVLPERWEVNVAKRVQVEKGGRIRKGLGGDVFQQEVKVGLVQVTPGWVVEKTFCNSSDYYNWTPVMSEDELWFRNFFFEKEYVVYHGVEGKIFVVCVMKGESLIRIVCYTAEDKIQTTVMRNKGTKVDGAWLRDTLCLPEKLSLKKMKNYPGTDASLLRYEESNTPRNFKFGVLYCEAGQTTESQMFQNDFSSPKFTQFLEFIGDVVKLKDHQGFFGGLANNGSTGEESVYTQFNNFEIMFHVSTMLPFTDNDEQQLERKRHIGNDVVTIVFVDGEGDASFSTDTIASHFIHTICVVRPVEVEGETMYYIQFARQSQVQQPLPYIAANKPHKPNEKLRKRLLCKLINSEFSSLKTTAFSSKWKTNGTLLDLIVKGK